MGALGEEEGCVAVELEGAGEVVAGGEEDFSAAGVGAGVEGFLEGGGVLGFAVAGGAEGVDVEGAWGGGVGGGELAAGGEEGGEGEGCD